MLNSTPQSVISIHVYLILPLELLKRNQGSYIIITTEISIPYSLLFIANDLQKWGISSMGYSTGCLNSQVLVGNDIIYKSIITQ